MIRPRVHRAQRPPAMRTRITNRTLDNPSLHRIKLPCAVRQSRLFRLKSPRIRPHPDRSRRVLIATHRAASIPVQPRSVTRPGQKKAHRTPHAANATSPSLSQFSFRSASGSSRITIIPSRPSPPLSFRAASGSSRISICPSRHPSFVLPSRERKLADIDHPFAPILTLVLPSRERELADHDHPFAPSLLCPSELRAQARPRSSGPAPSPSPSPAKPHSAETERHPRRRNDERCEADARVIWRVAQQGEHI